MNMIDNDIELNHLHEKLRKSTILRKKYTNKYYRVSILNMILIFAIIILGICNVNLKEANSKLIEGNSDITNAIKSQSMTLENEVMFLDGYINSLEDTIFEYYEIIIDLEEQLELSMVEEIAIISEDANTSSPLVIQAPSVDMSNHSMWQIPNLSSGLNGYRLSDTLQAYTYNTLKSKGLESFYPIMLALMEKESGFNPSAISSTNDYGICQINKSNHSSISAKIGVSNLYTSHGSSIFLDPYICIEASITLLQNIMWNKYDSYHKVLMVYNMGGSNAKKLWNEGTTTSAYSTDILARAAKYGYTGNGTI